MGRPRKGPREKDLTSRFLSGGLDEDRVDKAQRFGKRSKHQEQNRIARTTAMRRQDQPLAADVAALPVGSVVQVYSVFIEVRHQARTLLCTARKTLYHHQEGGIIVGDRVAVRESGRWHESGVPEGVIEHVLARETILTRSDSFKARETHPIVANAQQMLIVAAMAMPTVRWGLVDRMLVAASAGGLSPIVCLNKMDLSGHPAADPGHAADVLAHYRSMGIRTLESSVQGHLGGEQLRQWLADRVTVLAGHSGVGKSSLIRKVQPLLDLRISEVSAITSKGRHTTTGARVFDLDFGGQVIDTPGVKLFGLWGVTADSLEDHFPDVAAGTAPAWRQESYQRILASLQPSGPAT